MEALTCIKYGGNVHPVVAFCDNKQWKTSMSSSRRLCSSKGRRYKNRNVIFPSSPASLETQANVYNAKYCKKLPALHRNRSAIHIHISCSGGENGFHRSPVIGCFQQLDVKARASIAIDERAVAGNEENSSEDRSPTETGVVIVGAGLAGLAAARHCAREGIPFFLLEASDGVGGRVRTDLYQGFLLDRGFQIFISAYPEARKVLDYEALDLQTFYAGALVRFSNGFYRVADPFRHFVDGVASLLNPIGTAVDKVTVGIVRLRAAMKPVSEIWSSDETTILDRLKQEGFSDQMIDRFFRPFFGGIFFDRDLQTTSRLFEFVFKCLALGSNTLPAAGIGAIPEQIAKSLPQGSVLLNSRVVNLVEDNNGVVSGATLEDGRVIRAKHGVIIAAEGPEAARLLGKKLPATASVDRPPRSTTCLYFSAESTPVNEPVLLLNGTDDGIVNNMFFPSTVAPSYAPAGKTLVSVSLIGQYEKSPDSELEKQVREELRSWFGARVVDSWQHLRTYRIAFAQPDQAPPTILQKDPRLEQGVYVCGDHRDSSTFDGALVSGRRAVQALMADSNLVAQN